MTSTSFHPPGARTRSSIGVPTVLPWMLMSDTAATSWSSGWRNCSPSVPARRAASTPNSRSAASFAQISFTDNPVESSLTGDASHAVSLGLLQPVSNLKGIFDLGPLNKLLAADGKATVGS